MAKQTIIVLILTISCLLVSTLDVYARKQVPSHVAEEAASFLRDICEGREKVMHIRVYAQDLRIGHENATVVEVAKAAGVTDNSPYAFGSVHVVDDLMTEGPSIDSRKLGRVQGLTTSADLSTFGIAMNINIYFTDGPYAGSSLSILGRNQVMDERRELSVVGGTGIFRYARGYLIQTSYSTDDAAQYAVLEYNIYTTYDARLNNDASSNVREANLL